MKVIPTDHETAQPILQKMRLKAQGVKYSCLSASYLTPYALCLTPYALRLAPIRTYMTFRSYNAGLFVSGSSMPPGVPGLFPSEADPHVCSDLKHKDNGSENGIPTVAPLDSVLPRHR